MSRWSAQQSESLSSEGLLALQHSRVKLQHVSRFTSSIGPPWSWKRKQRLSDSVFGFFLSSALVYLFTDFTRLYLNEAQEGDSDEGSLVLG